MFYLFNFLSDYAKFIFYKNKFSHVNFFKNKFLSPPRKKLFFPKKHIFTMEKAIIFPPKNAFFTILFQSLM